MKKQIIQLKNVRITYPFLFQKKIWNDKEANDVNAKKGKYQITIIIPKNHDIVSKLQEQILAIKEAKFEGRGSCCLKDIDVLREEHTSYSDKEYDNTFILTAKNDYKPLVVENYQKINSATGKKEQVQITDELKIKSGDYANVFIELVPYEKPKKGILARLLAVQFWKHGEAFPKYIPDFDTFIDQESIQATDFDMSDEMDF